MPIVSNTSNKQMNVGKMPIKGEGGTMAVSIGHLPLALFTLISQWRIKNTKEVTLNLNLGVSKNQEVGGRGRTKGKKAARQLKASHKGKTMWQWLKCACAAADNRKSLMVIDNLIKLVDKQ